MKALFPWQSSFSAEGRNLGILLCICFNHGAPNPSPPGSCFTNCRDMFLKRSGLLLFGGVKCGWTLLLGSGRKQGGLISCLLFSNLALSQREIQQHDPFYRLSFKNKCFWGPWVCRWLLRVIKACPQHWPLSRLPWCSFQGQGRVRPCSSLHKEFSWLQCCALGV